MTQAITRPAEQPAEPGLAERLAEVSRLLRSPMAVSFGSMSQDGRDGRVALTRFFDRLPQSRIETPADALALMSFSWELFFQMIPYLEANDVTREGLETLSFSMVHLRAYLADQAGLEPNAFGLSKQEQERR